jgi:periplasmic protein TonB
MPQTTKPHFENSSERIMLKDMTCPLIRLNEARRKDKKIGFFVSVLIHLALFSGASILLIQQPKFSVDDGKGGMEVNLVATSQPKTEEPVETFVPQKSDFEEPIPEPVKNQPEPQKETSGKDQVTAQSQGGAITEAKPDYLQNPAPEYPFEARRKGWEGTVLLEVAVDRSGHPLDIKVIQSSGYTILDKTALKAVKEWKFLPAKLGEMPVESMVKVPIRFDLDNS